MFRNILKLSAFDFRPSILYLWNFDPMFLALGSQKLNWLLTLSSLCVQILLIISRKYMSNFNLNSLLSSINRTRQCILTFLSLFLHLSLILYLSHSLSTCLLLITLEHTHTPLAPIQNPPCLILPFAFISLHKSVGLCVYITVSGLVSGLVLGLVSVFLFWYLKCNKLFS
jgi:hypothetical protein